MSSQEDDEEATINYSKDIKEIEKYYTVVNHIGEGAFGKVMHVIEKQTNEHKAIKVLTIDFHIKSDYPKSPITSK